LKSIGIIGIGHAVPSKVLTNRDLEKMVETSDDWIVSRTGIRERRIAEPGDGTSRWACEAARKAMAQAGVKPEEIDLIIVGTTTPDMPLPSTACFVQKELGAKNAVCFDLAAACAGFVYSLSTAQQFLLNGTMKTALVIGADQISSFLDWKDRSTCVLFGDAGAAVILREIAKPARGIIACALGSDGEHADLLKIPGGGSKVHASAESVQTGQHFLKMNGAEVFKLAVRGMGQSIAKVLEQTGTRVEDVACIVPHQANMRIIDAVADRLKVDRSKIYVNLDRYGNTSAASVAMGLSEAASQGVIKKGDLVLLTTFGAGLVWGSALVEWGL
jgi:3-oxoacyl-[acyl-carrier-protein] synthase-3